jgi:dihydrofolate synthase/folylpolyglutamate synthase
VSLETPGASYPEVLLSLHGAHQADNAAIALAAVEAFLGRPLQEEIVADVFGTVRSPGRLEVVGHQPLVLLDGAHNVAGAHSLRVALGEEFPAAPRTLVVGLLREKDPAEMLEAVEVTACGHVVCCRPPSPRALDPELVAGAAIDAGLDPDRVEVVDAVADAVARAVELAGPGGQVVVTGSLYVVGAARAAFHRP